VGCNSGCSPFNKRQVYVMAVNFVPLHDRILVRRVEEKETTKSGLIIPDTAKEKPQDGEVLAVGKGKIKDDGKFVPMQVKPGDRVLFGKYAGTDIILDGEDYLIMREEEVLGINLGVATGKRASQGTTVRSA
jgi:chaperonin GroES